MSNSFQNTAEAVRIPATPGEVLDIQANMLGAGAPGGGLGLAFVDASNTILSYDFVITDTTTWKTYRKSMTCPANTARVIVLVSNQTAGYHIMTRPILTRRSPSDTAAASAISTLDATVSSQGGQITANASAITSLNTTVGGNVSAISALQTRANDIEQSFYASYTLSLDVNGYVSGFQSSNNGQSADFTILADNFRIMKPGGGARTEFSGDNWRVYDASGVLRVRLGVW